MFQLQTVISFPISPRCFCTIHWGTNKCKFITFSLYMANYLPQKQLAYNPTLEQMSSVVVICQQPRFEMPSLGIATSPETHSTLVDGSVSNASAASQWPLQSPDFCQSRFELISIVHPSCLRHCCITSQTSMVDGVKSGLMGAQSSEKMKYGVLRCSSWIVSCAQCAGAPSCWTRASHLRRVT